MMNRLVRLIQSMQPYVQATVLFAATRIKPYGDRLYERTIHCEVGYLGRPSVVDKIMIETQGLTPLSRFERWFMAPIIRIERKERRAQLAEYLAKQHRASHGSSNRLLFQFNPS